MTSRQGGLLTVAILAVAGALAVAYYLRRETATVAGPVREGPPQPEKADEVIEPVPGPVTPVEPVEVANDGTSQG